MMMTPQPTRIAVFNDLHLEMRSKSRLVYTPGSADVVVLSGDIHTKGRGVKWAQDTFDVPVVYVPGNHEGYGKHWGNIIADMREDAKGSHVHVLNNNSVVLSGVRFLGSTLWTKFDAWPDRQEAMVAAQIPRSGYGEGMNDYRVIRTDAYRRLRPNDTLSWNTEARNWLQEAWSVPFEGPTVIVTHHPPILEALGHPVARALDAAYANDWRDGVLASKASAWLYGHTHHALDTQVGDTLVSSRPWGYPVEELLVNTKEVLLVSKQGALWSEVPSDIMSAQPIPKVVKVKKPR